MTLAFGYNKGLVPGIKAAWGARWIVNQGGLVDQLHDRQDAFGDRERVQKLLAWLNAGANKQAQEKASEFLMRHTLDTRVARPCVLFQDGEGAIVANTNASAGYLYVAAWRFEDLPDGLKSKGLEMVCADIYSHVFRAPFGLPPTKEDEPICGAFLPDSWDFASSNRPPCPSCSLLKEMEESK